MLNALYLFIAAIGVGILGGMIYLIYLPFKKRFLKSGKLTKKLNSKINWIFIISLCLLCTILYCFRDYRTPSKTRLERIADVKIPSGFKVLKDEYQDRLQDYVIYYNIELNERTTKELIKNIKASKFYNKSLLYERAWSPDIVYPIDSIKAIWAKSPTGYDFYRENGSTDYFINLDTLTNTLKYSELAD